MSVSPETLLAFVEGELSPEEARRVAAEVANDPTLAAHVEHHRALKQRLQAAALAADGTAPSTPAEPMTLSEPATESPPPASVPPRLVPLIPVGAMAAGVVLGILLTASLTPAADFRTEGDTVVADGTLARALTMAIASDRNGAAFAPITVGDSFFSNDGVFCRVFRTGRADRGGLSGIACQEDGQWRIHALARPEGREGAKGDREPELAEAVRGMLSTMMAGGPLDAEGERAARAQRWLVR